MSGFRHIQTPLYAGGGVGGKYADDNEQPFCRYRNPNGKYYGNDAEFWTYLMGKFWIERTDYHGRWLAVGVSGFFRNAHGSEYGNGHGVKIMGGQLTEAEVDELRSKQTGAYFKSQHYEIIWFSGNIKQMFPQYVSLNQILNLREPQRNLYIPSLGDTYWREHVQPGCTFIDQLFSDNYPEQRKFLIREFMLYRYYKNLILFTKTFFNDKKLPSDVTQELWDYIKWSSHKQMLHNAQAQSLRLGHRAFQKARKSRSKRRKSRKSRKR